MLGNQRVMEINGKVFKDIKNYLDDKERTASIRVIKQLLRWLEHKNCKKTFCYV